MKLRLRKVWIGCLALLFLVGLACTGADAAQQQGAGNTVNIDNATKAVAVLHPTVGHKAYGVIIFDQEANGVLVVADLGGLSPGVHTVQIHEYGDCSNLDAASAGKIFNPKTKQKSPNGKVVKHPPVGELGQIDADSSGHARLEMVDPLFSVGGPGTIIGRSVVVETGSGGPRTACGVIGIATK